MTTLLSTVSKEIKETCYTSISNFSTIDIYMVSHHHYNYFAEKVIIPMHVCNAAILSSTLILQYSNTK